MQNQSERLQHIIKELQSMYESKQNTIDKYNFLTDLTNEIKNFKNIKQK